LGDFLNCRLALPGPKIRKTTQKIATFFSKKTTTSQQVKVAVDLGLQEKASTVAEAPSEFEITPHSAQSLDFSPSQMRMSLPARRLNSMGHQLRF